MDKNQKIKLLLSIRSTINNGWTQGSLARNAKGQPVNIHAKTAVSFCLLGAIGKAYNEYYELAENQPSASVIELYNHILSIDPKGMQSYNDLKNRKKEDIIQAIDFVIQTIV